MFALFSRNAWSLSGAALATTAAVAWFFFLTAGGGNPYVGILTAAVLPLVLLAGLALVPFGIWRERHRNPAPPSILWPRIAVFAAVTTILNVVILANSGYKVVHYMDSVSFCGQACHTPMEPQFVAYGNAPHSRVDCVRCHIEPSASGYFKAKWNGAHQALAAIRGDFARPIHPPAGKLPGTASTCAACHDVGRLPAERLRVIPRFSNDEVAAAKPSVLVMRTAKVHAMHVTGAMAMSCTECHSRPAHSFESPEDAVDRALAAGDLDRTLAFVRTRGVAALREGASAAEAAAKFAAHYGGSAAARKSAAVLQSIHARNVFAAMKVTWGTYPNRLGHEGGCLRCHDGKSAGQDCETCHSLVSMEEVNPKILSDLGLAAR